MSPVTQPRALVQSRGGIEEMKKQNGLWACQRGRSGEVRMLENGLTWMTSWLPDSREMYGPALWSRDGSWSKALEQPRERELMSLAPVVTKGPARACGGVTWVSKGQAAMEGWSMPISMPEVWAATCDRVGYPRAVLMPVPGWFGYPGLSIRVMVSSGPGLQRRALYGSMALPHSGSLLIVVASETTKDCTNAGSLGCHLEPC